MALFQNVQEEFQWEEYLRDNFDVKSTPSDELRVCCFVCGDTKHKLYVNPVKRRWNCFSAETKVMTWDGYQEIGTLVGKVVKILTIGVDNIPRWVQAPFESFGKQQLWNVTLSRNGVKKTIRATAAHRWFVRTGDYDRYLERTTACLRPGHSMRVVRGPRPGNVLVSPWGAAHGFVYGDGERSAQGTRVTLWGEKDAAVLKFFPLSTRFPVMTDNGVPGTTVIGLPDFFKSLPNIDESAAYLYGWLAGYFAADGCVDYTGMPVLASANRDNLEFVRLVCLRLGIFTYGIRVQSRLGYGKELSNIYSLSLSRKSLSSEFFLTEEHNKRWNEHSTVNERPGWTVVSAEPTDLVEDVFCAVVPESHNFALEDNILTGNCFKCSFRSGQFDTFDFVAQAEGITRARAITRLVREYAKTTPDDPMFALKEQEAAVVGNVILPQPIKIIAGLPEAAKLLLERNDESAPFWDYLVSRGLTPSEIRGVRVHYIPDQNCASLDTKGKYRGDIGRRIVTPIYGGNKELVSWQARVIDPNHPGHDKYLTAPESELAKTLWPYVTPYGKHAVLVEGVLDCVAMRRVPTMSAYATFSKKISHDQIILLKSWDVTEVTVFWDKKDARKEIIQAVKELHMHFDKVYVSKMTTWPSNKDPGSLLTDPNGAQVIQEAIEDKLDTYESLDYAKWQLTF